MFPDRPRVYRACVPLIVALCLVGCRSAPGPQPLEPFSTDGCSMFPDGRILACCTDHDIDYWQGGSAERRRTVDRQFRYCVEQVSGSPAFAEIAYRSVRVGGNPHLPPAAGWGYGWPFGRGYEPLSRKEIERVRQALRASLEAVRDDCAAGRAEACQLQVILERRPELQGAP